MKLCDFGVSGQLEKSLAKTNIGCQSYMAVGAFYSAPSPVLRYSLLDSPSASEGNPRIIWGHIRSRRMCGR